MHAQKRNDERDLSLIKSGHAAVSRLTPAHDEHLHSLRCVLSELQRRGIPFDEVRADQLGTKPIGRQYDLVIAVGGDGTVIDAARRLGHAPLLGVKSAASSHAHFCMSDARSFPTLLTRILAGELKPVRIMRLRALLDGKPIGNPVINEIFAENASGTASYILRIGEHEEAQMSDGLMIGPAAGSTAWMSWYGSDIMDIGDRRIQYVVRGPNPWMPLTLKKGILTSARSLQVISKMTDGYVAVDGRRNSFPFPRGSVLTVQASRQDLKLYVDPQCNDAYRRQAAAS
jgi:NAD kinase